MCSCGTGSSSATISLCSVTRDREWNIMGGSNLPFKNSPGTLKMDTLPTVLVQLIYEFSRTLCSEHEDNPRHFPLYRLMYTLYSPKGDLRYLCTNCLGKLCASNMVFHRTWSCSGRVRRISLKQFRNTVVKKKRLPRLWCPWRGCRCL